MDLSGLAADMENFERAWDERLGGFSTRGHRELACYILGRLLAFGVSLEDFHRYQKAVIERYVAPTGATVS